MQDILQESSLKRVSLKDLASSVEQRGGHDTLQSLMSFLVNPVATEFNEIQDAGPPPPVLSLSWAVGRPRYNLNGCEFNHYFRTDDSGSLIKTGFSELFRGNAGTPEEAFNQAASKLLDAKPLELNESRAKEYGLKCNTSVIVLKMNGQNLILDK